MLPNHAGKSVSPSCVRVEYRTQFIQGDIRYTAAIFVYNVLASFGLLLTFMPDICN